MGARSLRSEARSRLLPNRSTLTRASCWRPRRRWRRRSGVLCGGGASPRRDGAEPRHHTGPPPPHEHLQLLRTMHTADVVLIGGGIVGSSIAYHLVAAGCKNVLVIE